MIGGEARGAPHLRDGRRRAAPPLVRRATASRARPTPPSAARRRGAVWAASPRRGSTGDGGTGGGASSSGVFNLSDDDLRRPSGLQVPRLNGGFRAFGMPAYRPPEKATMLIFWKHASASPTVVHRYRFKVVIILIWTYNRPLAQHVLL